MANEYEPWGIEVVKRRALSQVRDALLLNQWGTAPYPDKIAEAARTMLEMIEVSELTWEQVEAVKKLAKAFGVERPTGLPPIPEGWYRND